jgi:uncharacterized membrane protein YcaP (DUF421 family)
VIAHDIGTMGIPIAEKVLRTVAVYGGIAVLLRLGGKRDLAQLNTFDLVVILLLSNVVQNAIIGNDNSVVGGLLGATILVVLNSLVVRSAGRSEKAIAVFEGTPTKLVQDGNYIDHALHREGLRKADVAVALRRQGATKVTDVKEAVLAPGGSIIVTLKPEAETATRHDIDALHATLRELDAKVSAISR